MNWKNFRNFLWIDTRFRFIGKIPQRGALLDIGSSDGVTLNHFYEARPDINFYSTDLEGMPEKYPTKTQFYRADITKDRLPWNENSIDGITCMQLVEHIDKFDNLFAECNRVLKYGADMYIETPHPKTLILSIPIKEQAGDFTYNFLYDLTHKSIVPIGKVAKLAKPHGFEVKKIGTSRNLLFAFSYFFRFLLSPRKRMITRIHYLGWSSYIILTKMK
jgi:SAM-dependent methyltransferase